MYSHYFLKTFLFIFIIIFSFHGLKVNADLNIAEKVKINKIVGNVLERFFIKLEKKVKPENRSEKLGIILKKILILESKPKYKNSIKKTYLFKILKFKLKLKKRIYNKQLANIENEEKEIKPATIVRKRSRGGGGGGGSYTPPAPTDTTSPSIPQNISSVNDTYSISLNWDNSTDNIGVTGYEIYRDTILVGTVVTNTYLDGSLSPNTSYTYTILAYDVAGNKSILSSEYITITDIIPVSDTTSPSIPQNISSVNDTYSISLNWDNSTDNVGVSGYEIYRDTILIGTGATNTYLDGSLSPNTSYTYTILAYDIAGNKSILSSEYITTTDIIPVSDTTAPSTPQNISSVNGVYNVSLNWDNSTDNVGVSGYEIYRDTILIATGATNTYLDGSLSPNTSYTYTILAYDVAGNKSTLSGNHVVTTLDSSISYSNFPSQINLSWVDLNSTGLTIYKIHRDSGSGFVEVASTQMRGLQDTLLEPEKSYSYKIYYNTGTIDNLLDGGEATIFTTKRSIKLQVYENTGNNVADYSLQAFIPLPYGVYGSGNTITTPVELANTFVVKNSSGSIIPAQFWVRSRWYGRDSSIKELVAVFKGTNIEANSGKGGGSDPIALEYFLEHGITNNPSNPVTVSSDINSINVSNKNVNFSINKNNFNFFDNISYKGKEVINNEASDGGYMLNRFGNTYLESLGCTNLAPTIYEIEEDGPVRARIKVERPSYVVKDNTDPCYSLFGEKYDPVPGFVVWFDLYYDSDEIKVNYNILNNAISPYGSGTVGAGLKGWPLFYEEAGISFDTPLISPIVSVIGDSTEYSFSGELLKTSTGLTMSGVNIANNFTTLKIQDSSGVGFAIIDPLSDYTFPVAFDYSSIDQKLKYKISPNGCSECEGYNYNVDPSETGLYAINDLSLQDKQFTIQLFDSGSIIDYSKNKELLVNPPSVAMSVDDYSSIGTSSDLYGITQKYTENNTSLDMSFSNTMYKWHSQTFGINFTRYRSCTTGGKPYTAMDILIDRPPQTNRWAVNIYDDIKRPQVIPKYWSGVVLPLIYTALGLGPDISSNTQTLGHFSTEFSTSGYCKNLPIRAFFGNSGAANPYYFSDFTTKRFPGAYSATGAFISGYIDKRSMTAFPRDNAHLWMQQLSDVAIDNPLLPYFKTSYEQYLQSYPIQLLAKANSNNIYESEGDSWPDNSTRGIGNSLISLVDFYLESGDANSLISIESYLDYILLKQLDHGGLSATFSFQDGYMKQGVINAMSLVPKEHNIYKKGISYLFGGGNYRSGLSGIIDAMNSTQFGYYDYIGCRFDAGLDCKDTNGGGSVSIDPSLVASLLLVLDESSNNIKATDTVQHLTNYLDNVYGGTPYNMGTTWRINKWDGDLDGRSINLIGKMVLLDTKDWLKELEHKEGLPLY